MYQLSREPQGIGKLLDSGVRLYLTGFTRVALFALIWSVIAAAPGFGGGAEDLLTADTAAAAALDLGQIISAIIAFLVSMFFYTAIYDRYNRVALNKENSFIGSFIEGLARGVPFIVYLILYSIVIVFGLLLLIIPGLWLATMFALGGNAIVIEKQGPLAAMKTSWHLARGNWWRCTVVLAVVLIIHLLFTLALGVIIGLVVGGMFDPANPDMIGQMNTIANTAQVLYIAMNAVIFPLWAAVLTVIYHDLSLRKEGGDLATRFDGLEAANDDDGGYY